ncbi:MAG: DUF72 domain-containing protein [Proteobacteria bacterium]|nr:DUF72 domain-containing protein [Pseudomonadota bacterium]
MMETSIRVGTVDFPVTKKLVLADVDVVEITAANPLPPKPSTATKWRKEAPARVDFTVQLPRFLFERPPPGTPLDGDLKAYGSFQVTDETLKLWNKTMRFANGLEARSLILLTPAEFTPTRANRNALSRFLEDVNLSGCEIVWEPRGPWEHEQAAAFALEKGMILAVDPLRDPPPPGRSAYFRLGPFAAMGSRIGVYDLERLTEATIPFEHVTCVFQTPRALDDARNLKKVLAESELI